MIELAKLTADGLRLEGSMGYVQVEANEALRNLQWQLFIQPSDQDFFFDIKAEAVFESNCGRCLEPVDRETRLKAQFMGSSDPELVARGSYTIGIQDLDVVYLPEEILDEEALIREQFILQRPMQFLCRDDCQGLCPQCGKNWNKGQCQCCPEYDKPPGVLAAALAEIKLNLNP